MAKSPKILASHWPCDRPSVQATEYRYVRNGIYVRVKLQKLRLSHKPKDYYQSLFAHCNNSCEMQTMYMLKYATRACYAVSKAQFMFKYYVGLLVANLKRWMLRTPQAVRSCQSNEVMPSSPISRCDGVTPLPVNQRRI